MEKLYNQGIGLRVNDWIRQKLVLPRLRRKLKNKNITILANNCNGGYIYHDLGLQFNSPTINLFFYKDHFITFCEDLDYYLNEELKKAEKHLFKIDKEYPICTLGGGEDRITLSSLF